MHPLFRIASVWESSTDDVRESLRKVVTDLVGYPCKMACIPNHGSIDILVSSGASCAVQDWLELQPSGAFGVIFDQYTENDGTADAVSKRCDIYNDRNQVEFCSGSESETDSDSDSDPPHSG